MVGAIKANNKLRDTLNKGLENPPMVIAPQYNVPRFNDNGEGHSPRVHQYILNEEGWPCELPYQTQGEKADVNGYEVSDITGRYFVLNQGSEIDNTIANPCIIYLNEDGTTLSKENNGSFSVKENSNYMSINIDGTEYKGVFVKMKDEAGVDVMTFSAVGNNQTVWGVKYLQ